MPTDYEEAIRRDFRWNFAIIAGVDGVWGFGSAFVSYVVILPVFLQKLGASELAIGLLPAAFMFFLTIPQLLVARLTRHLPVKKFFFTVTHFPGCLSLLILSYLAFRISDHRSAAYMSFVVACTFAWLILFGLSISFAMPMWVNLMAKLFPSSVRGRSFGYVFLLNSVCGAIGSALAGMILGWASFPYSFAILFLLAGVLLSGCVTFFFWLREPPKHPEPQSTDRHFLREVVDTLRSERDFIWFLLARFVGAFCLMGAAFYTVAGLDKFGLSEATAGTFGAIMLGAQVLGALLGGRWGDRFGFKSLATVVPLFDAATAALAMFAPSPMWYYLVFALYGARRSFAMVGVYNLTIEFCPAIDKTTFIAMGSTAVCPAFVAGPIIGGLLAQHHPAGYNAVFVVTMACGFLAFLLMALRVREPRRFAKGG